MPNAARLSGVGTFFAFEFDDNTKTSFSVSAGSTVYASNIDETAFITTSESLSSISVPTTASFNDGRSSHTLTGLLSGDFILYAAGYQSPSDFSLPTDFDPAFSQIVNNYNLGAGQYLYKGTSGSYTITGITTTNNPATVIGVFRNVGGTLAAYTTSSQNSTTYPKFTSINESASEGDLLLSIGAASWDGGTISAPSNFTLVGDSVSNNVHTMMAYRVVPSDGSYNGGTFSGTNPVASDPNDNTMFIFRILDSEPPPALRVENDGEIKLNNRDTSIINEVDTFDNIPTSNLELHLDASSGFTTTTLPTSWQDLSGNNRHMRIAGDTNVSLLLNGNGSNGSTTITDSSTYNHSITVNGNAQISTAQSKFGGSSIVFDGSGDYVRAANSSEFAFGTGDFTIEAWLRGTFGSFFDTRTSLFGAGFGYAVNPTGRIGIYDGQGASNLYTGSTAYTWSDWHHVAFSRSGTTLRVFVDGSLDGTVTTSRNLTEQGGIVGANINQVLGSSGANVFNGYIDDLRVTKGVARYTSNFTPPHSQLSVYWSPYVTYGGQSGNSTTAHIIFESSSTIQVGQSVVIPEISSISGVGTFTYNLFNASGPLGLSGNGDVRLSSTNELQTPVVGPIGETIGTRELFRFGGSNYTGFQNATLIIPPQQVPYNAFKITYVDDGTPIVPAQSSSINNERASVLNVPFESSDSRLGVCDGTGSASAYTGVTGTAARTVIVGVKVPASPSTSHTIFSYGANSAGQRFNIRLQSTGVIQIQFGSSFANIPVSAIDDRNDFLLIAVTVPANATVSDVRVWLNGNEVTSQLLVNNGSTSINTSSANNVTIGGGSHGTVEYLDDSVITKVMMYSSVLSELEIKQIYQSIIPDIYPFVERAS